MIDPAYHVIESREPRFYLARLLGPKLAVLVVLLVLYLSVRHQLIAHLDASTVNLGLAHAEARVKLALFGDPDLITTFYAGGKTYDLTRHTIVHANLFVECWRAVLWQIERGTIVAAALLAAPPFAWFLGCTGWELWRGPGPEPEPALPFVTAAQIEELYAREVQQPPLNRFEPEPVEEAPKEADGDAAAMVEAVQVAAPPEAPTLPTAVPRKRVRKPKAPPESGPQDVTPTPPLVQPGQVRKRLRREP